MAVKDLADYLAPDLQLAYRGKVYTVAPPSKDDGLRLAAINAFGLNFSGDQDEARAAIGPKLSALWDAMAEDEAELGPISLGAAYDEMVADGMPGPHLDTYAQYALYYWVLGEATADAIMESWREARDGAGDPKAAFRRPSPSGPSTASASRRSGLKGSPSTPSTQPQKARLSAEQVETAPESDGPTSSNDGI